MYTIDVWMRRLARAFAYLGGAVLVALVLVTCASVLGRAFATMGHSPFVAQWLPFLASPLQAFSPVTGDFELVEAGVAFAIMASIPWCQLSRGHAKVDVLTAFLPGAANRTLMLVWEVVFALAFALIAWRLYEGLLAKQRYGETTFMLRFPIWWGYAACFAASVVATLAAWWSVVLHGIELLSSRGAVEPPA